ncbi:oxygen-independent coproporphyrinogen-III oxidase 1 [Gottschalkia acidurici 9a]|uniref:Heme chaperone HemW n=1 Tax=Gottschalkia acidurici (strain ATCC 7906 / DSM 604 / BCRC 14475 / CIP 104303 / KCTC 5404 / NCIMB 10678 / 9a) TaxID=1128398 RepID=K0B187_GOTA9|nr:radical SAM family heme chaperone HemW [Gottschalkia acidurici]AFS78837.1 oxygen-independent coproporphyrinogen-III oxidase 1 [Gottschalkia acidurici 9a]
MKRELGIYIHIPFCYSKCYYCDFNSHIDQYSYIEKYIEYLKKEIDLYENSIKEYKLKTIFFGGGTPSLIDQKYICEIIEYIYKKMNTQYLEEITIEANPKTLNEAKLSAYRDAGVNRISLGLQTLNDNLLKNIGRIHSVQDFYDTYNLIRKNGFKNINVDIMFNLPNQSVTDVLDTLEKVVELDIEHISLYSLKVEEGTPFYNMYESGEITLPDEDIEREMYHRSIRFLEDRGYKQYEISNFSKKDYECKHNLIYWKLKPYIGLGLSAHSNIGSYRYGNVESFSDYFSLIDEKKLPIIKDEKEFIDIDMEIAEYIILGLRLTKGIDKQEFKLKYNKGIEEVFKENLDKFINQGLICQDDKVIRLTKRGLDLCNLVFMELLPD